MLRAARKSAEHWAGVIAEYRRGDERAAEFCERRGIRLATFRRWHSRLAAVAPDAPGPSPSPSLSRPSAFIEVRPSPPASTSATVTLRLGAELSVECPAELGMSAIAELARAVRDGR